MFNRINMKSVSVIFGVLLVLVLISLFIGNDRKNSSFKSQLTDFVVDEAKEIVIIPKLDGEEIRLEKEGEIWKVKQAGQTFNADDVQVNNMLKSIAHMKAKRLASKSEKGWKKYEVNDSLAVQVEVNGDSGPLAHLYIGKFSFSQSPQSKYSNQQSRGVMTNFVRLAGEDETYAVDGYLQMAFNRDLKNYRDQHVVNIPKDEIEQVKVDQPGGGFVLKKSGDVWMIDGVAADSTSAARYISKLAKLRSRNFLPSEQFSTPNSTHQLSIWDKDGQEIVEIDANYADSTNIAVRSSINPGTVFDGTKSDLFKKLFVNKANFQ